MFLADIPLVCRVESLELKATHLTYRPACCVEAEQVVEDYDFITKHVLHMLYLTLVLYRCQINER